MLVAWWTVTILAGDSVFTQGLRRDAMDSRYLRENFSSLSMRDTKDVQQNLIWWASSPSNSQSIAWNITQINYLKSWRSSLGWLRRSTGEHGNSSWARSRTSHLRLTLNLLWILSVLSRFSVKSLNLWSLSPPKLMSSVKHTKCCGLSGRIFSQQILIL